MAATRGHPKAGIGVMKFTMPRLVTAMAVRAIDATELARCARDHGMPVSAATIRKAMKGEPVTVRCATRIASVLDTIPALPEMTEVIGEDPVRPRQMDEPPLNPQARVRRPSASQQGLVLPGRNTRAVASLLVRLGQVDWTELARIVAKSTKS